MTLLGPFGLLFAAGAAMYAAGFWLVYKMLGRHGGLDRSRTLSVVFGEDSPMKRPEARGDRMRFRAGVFLMAFGVILHLNPRHAFWLEVAALVGFALSALIWLGVAVTTPAPMAVVDAAKLGARRVHDRLPAEIRERLPEEFRLKITGS